MKEHRELKSPEPVMPIGARLFWTWAIAMFGLAAVLGGLVFGLYVSGVIE